MTLMEKTRRWRPPRLRPKATCVLAALALGALPLSALPPWSVQLLYGQSEIFPSVLVSVTESAVFPPRHPGQLGDPTGIIAAEIIAPEDNWRVRVTVGATVIFGESSVEVVLPRRGEVYRVAPFLELKHEVIAGLKHPIARELIDVTVAHQPGDRELKSVPVRIWAISDCPFYVLTPRWIADAKGGTSPRSVWLDTRYLVAAFANEYNGEVIPRIIRQALDRHIDRFSGYDSVDREGVRAQVRAVYNAMHDLGFKYSMLFRASSSVQGADAQRIRFAGDAIGARQTNCIDGTALMAGILTRLGLNASIYLTPTHAFLGVDLDGAGRESIEVETTEVWSNPFDHAVLTGRSVLENAKKSAAFAAGFSPYSQVAAEDVGELKGGRLFRLDLRGIRRSGILSISEAESP